MGKQLDGPTEPSPPPSPGVPGEGVTPITRILVLLFAMLQVLAAAGVWWLMPGGFPVDHPRFWVNRVLPVTVAAFAIAVIVLAYRKQWRTVTALLLCTPITMLAAAISGAAVFPISGRKPGVVVGVFTVVLFLAIRRRMLDWWPPRKWLAIGAVVPLMIGIALPLSQRSPLPDTRPIGPETALPEVRPVDTMLPNVPVGRARVGPSAGLVSIPAGPLAIGIRPLLTFTSRSPDRCWTIFSPRRFREHPYRLFAGIETSDHGVSMRYLDDGYSTLEVTQNPKQSHLAMTATTILPRAVYSHLNAFTYISVGGHKKLSLVFSGAPTTPIDVTYREYPFGRPMRSAHLAADGTFRIVEGSSGEKGPFRILASGRLGRDEPLTIEIRDQGVPVAALKLHDFASQAGVQLSPTAGWGLPVNSIDFMLESPGDGSMASIWVSLASTGVGRGYDSVGHTAGTYRNRIDIGPAVQP
jgi:hypothetical protein